MQECKLEEDSPNDVADTSDGDVIQNNDVGDILAGDNFIWSKVNPPEGLGSFTNADRQRRLT